jgi:hypothetical protein
MARHNGSKSVVNKKRKKAEREEREKQAKAREERVANGRKFQNGSA